eukprot:4982235-Pleurochrysis_carterae.AAC.1
MATTGCTSASAWQRTKKESKPIVVAAHHPAGVGVLVLNSIKLLGATSTESLKHGLSAWHSSA